MKNVLFLVIFAFFVVLDGVSQVLTVGVAISERFVITSYDAIQNERFVQLKFGDNEWRSAEYFDGSVDQGWCILRLSEDAPAFVSVGEMSGVEYRDEVYMFCVERAMDSDGNVTFYDGEIYSVGKDTLGRTLIHHSINVGNSVGAVLFLEKNNSFLGFMVAGHRQKVLALNDPKIQNYIGRSERVSRRMNRKAMCQIRRMGGGRYRVSRNAFSSNSMNDTNTRTYQKYKDSVATITIDGGGQGTGFICEERGKKYFVTNRHVARSRGKMTAYFLDGKKIEFSLDSIIEVADNRDLVRFEVQDDRPVLQISNMTPNIGEKVEFYGNAGGKGVVTVTTGKILAVGQEQIEISSPIQSGNSGSPLVRISDGCVIGVTTFSTFNRIEGDPSKVGTRYDPNVRLTREFAVRFTGVTWRKLPYRDYLKSVNVYCDLSLFYNLMKKVCIADRQYGVYDYQLADFRFDSAKPLNTFIKMIAKSDELEKKAFDRLNMMYAQNEKNPTRPRYGKIEIALAKKNIKDKKVAAYKVRKEVLYKILSYCKTVEDLTKEEKEIVVDAFDWLYRTYCEKYRMQLQGVIRE